MIARIRGEVVDTGDDYVVVEAGGVGYRVRVPVPAIFRLRDAPEVTLYTEQIIRQDAMLLYGFETKSERLVFSLLISVSRVGPQLANAILGHLSVREIAEAISAGNPSVFERVPGIGRTGAERIVLELKKKIRPVLPALVQEGPPISSGRSDAILALVSLGYGEDDAAGAVDEAMKECRDRSAAGLTRAALLVLKEWR